MYRAQGLRAGALGVGGEGVSKHAYAYLAVPVFRKGAVQLAAAALVARLNQVQVAVFRVYVHGVGALLSRLADERAARLFVAGVVGILAYGHAEDVAKSGPVAHVSLLVQHGGQNLCEYAQPALRADEECILKILNGHSAEVALVTKHKAVHGVVVFTVYRVETDVAVVLFSELHQGEAPELGEDEFLAKFLEPRRAELPVNFLIGFPLALKFDGYLCYAAQAFRHNAREVQVEVRALVHVVEAHAVAVIDAARRCHGIHVVLQVEVEQLRHLQHHVGLAFSRCGEHAALRYTAALRAPLFQVLHLYHFLFFHL